jgi:hypothetical protein
MTRTFTIRHTPNENGFSQFIVIDDTGKPYFDSPTDLSTNDPLEVIKAAARFLSNPTDDCMEKIMGDREGI